MPTDPRINLVCLCGSSFFQHLDRHQRMQATFNNPVDGDPMDPPPGCSRFRPKGKAVSLIPDSYSRPPDVASLIHPAVPEVAEATEERPDPFAVKALDQIDSMLEDSEERWDFALPRLTSMRDWIARNNHVTVPMQTAIHNIYEGGLKGRSRHDDDE